ncbi:MAG TPA: hypothetical protein DEZ09_02435 [Holosporales bacterium]|nr:hypothetical protein [Holosporales bacterium]
MIKRGLKSNLAQDMIAFLASLYMRFVFWTSCWARFRFDIPLAYLQNQKPFITCFWHSRLLLLPYAWPGKKNTFFMLISAHKDGRIISKTVKHFGIETIAGSTQRGGMGALREMVRLSKQGKTVGITPDGPRGPRFQVSEGAVMAAYFSKADLIPVTYSVKHHKVLQTWDHFFLPSPFSRGIVMWGEPIAYPKTKDQIVDVRKKLKMALDNLNQKADAQVNR